MPTYKTPGVYVEEISTLPPSVAEVSTAIPAFIGYTEKGPELARVNTLLEFEEAFGSAKPRNFSVKTSTGEGPKTIQEVKPVGSGSDLPEFLLYYSISHYFKNGGGTCYVLSIGDYSKPPAKADFLKGLRSLEKEDEPTLILLTDAVSLASADYYELCGQVLNQCNKLGDRFGIFDVKDGGIEEFRNKIGTNYLMYGGAYHPYLRTSLSHRYQENGVLIEGASPGGGSGSSPWEKVYGPNSIVVRSTSEAAEAPKVKTVKGKEKDPVTFSTAANLLTIQGVAGQIATDVAAAWDKWKSGAGNKPAGFEIAVQGDGTGTLTGTGASEALAKATAPAGTEGAAGAEGAADASGASLASIKSTETGLYNKIKTALTEQRVVLPPSAAMAGIYASVDRNRGVWKAPANVSVAAVIGPIQKIDHDQQEGLNVDPTGGKSINAIREFTGKGTLVWGARTLAGNDNEWRYVSVRRLFNMIEESAQKATGFAVFEPNDMTTWLKVKGMIESYLYGLWEQGALAGPAPEASYFVNVGLGKTMTTQDILEGRMVVEIGVAAVRPAEFIILRFSHKLQEA